MRTSRDAGHVWYPLTNSKTITQVFSVLKNGIKKRIALFRTIQCQFLALSKQKVIERFPKALSGEQVIQTGIGGKTKRSDNVSAKRIRGKQMPAVDHLRKLRCEPVSIRLLAINTC